MTDTIYAVSRGTYEDYEVLAVCASRELAEQVVDSHNQDKPGYRDGACVEELLYLHQPPQQVTTYRIDQDLWDNQALGKKNEHTWVEWEFDMLNPQYNAPVYWRWVRAPVYQDRGGGGRIEVAGTDYELVHKTFMDQRREILSLDPKPYQRGPMNKRRRREVTGP